MLLASSGLAIFKMNLAYGATIVYADFQLGDVHG
jgi:hypothetical protein